MNKEQLRRYVEARMRNEVAFVPTDVLEVLKKHKAKLYIEE